MHGQAIKDCFQKRDEILWRIRARRSGETPDFPPPGRVELVFEHAKLQTAGNACSDHFVADRGDGALVWSKPPCEFERANLLEVLAVVSGRQDKRQAFFRERVLVLRVRQVLWRWRRR